MDRQASQLKKLAAMAGSFDDQVYMTYGSKGLLRRARKKLADGTQVNLAGMDGNDIVFQVDDQKVKMGEAGPLKAACTCPAPESCVHVIMVCLQLETLAASESTPAPSPNSKNQPPESAPEDPLQRSAEENKDQAADPWLGISGEMLRKWGSAEVYRRAWRILELRKPKVRALEVTFNDHTTCHLIPDAGLDGLVTNAPPKEHQAYAIAAVLAYQAEHGLHHDPDIKKTVPLAGPDLTLLPDIRELLEEMIRLGLNHLSMGFVQRIHGLSVLCRTGRLFRPASELESCAQEIEWIATRHARASIPGLFNRMAKLYALVVAIGHQDLQASVELTGTARSTYDALDALALVGLGIYPWETESGFWGVTALFWAPELEEYFSWSDSRPRHSPDGFTPIQRYEQEAPWSGGQGLKVLSRSSFVLEHPKANQVRRLSGHDGCRVKKMDIHIQPGQFPAPFTAWSHLRETMLARQKIGLRRGAPLDALCRIRPHAWGQPFFDESQQKLIVPLGDEQKDQLLLALPFTPWTESAIYYLEKHYAELKGQSLLGYYSRPSAPELFPISLVSPDSPPQVSDLLFMPVPKKKVKWRGIILEKIRSFIPLPETNGTSPERAPSETDEIALFLSPLDDYLLRIAESGLQVPDQGFPLSAMDLAGAGFLLLDEDLKNLDSCGDLLMTRYHYLLHLDALGHGL